MHHRRSIRLKDYDYSQAGAYFVTLCAWQRKCIFGSIVDGEMQLTPLGIITQDCWTELREHFPNVDLEIFRVMPNHFHAIIVIRTETVGAIHVLPLQTKGLARRRMLLPKIIGRFKMTSAKRINEVRGTPSVPVWQRNYYEHVIRDDKSFGRIQEYIQTNVLRWEVDKENPSFNGVDEFDNWMYSIKKPPPGSTRSDQRTEPFTSASTSGWS
jgi:REP element-mobilizing transposase RayT